MAGFPITLVDSGGYPVTEVASGAPPASVVESGGLPATLVTSGGIPLVLFGNAPALADLEPSASWNGTAGSGFASTPTDPTRTTAKPVLRLMVPPNQMFTDTLLVGVFAAANNGGSLLTNLGMEKVSFHYEGNTADVTAPSLQTFDDANGNPVTYLGWWVRLIKPAGTWDTSDVARLYVEGVPSDGTMQNRVIGPYSFTPVDTLHDREVTVTPSSPVVAGSNYQTLMAAIQYLKGVSAQNPRITITEAGTYGMARQAPAFTGANGRWLIEASVPVTIGYTSYTTDSASFLDPRVSALCFRGSNITLDLRYVDKLVLEGTGKDPWFDGCNIINSGTGTQLLWRGGNRPSTEWAEDNPWLTECTLTRVSDTLNATNLARGCTATEGYRDSASQAFCIIGNTISDHTNTFWQTERNALQITGPAGATIDLVGGNDANTRSLILKESGVTVGTLTIGKSEALYIASNAGTLGPNQAYFVSDVVDWVNTFAGWTATLDNDDFRASVLSFTGLKGAGFTALDVSTTQQLITYTDNHGDFYQHLANAPGENFIVAFNTMTESEAQNIFLNAGNPKDGYFINNALLNVAGDVTEGYKSQFNTNHSNIVVVHNSMPLQEILLSTSYTSDTYCLIANNAVTDMTDASADPCTIANMVLDTGATGTGDTGEVKAGTSATKFADPENGDFSPIGPLASNLFTPRVSRDRNNEARAATDAAGAVKVS